MTETIATAAEAELLSTACNRVYGNWRRLRSLSVMIRRAIRSRSAKRNRCWSNWG